MVLRLSRYRPIKPRITKGMRASHGDRDIVVMLLWLGLRGGGGLTKTLVRVCKDSFDLRCAREHLPNFQ